MVGKKQAKRFVRVLAPGGGVAELELERLPVTDGALTSYRFNLVGGVATLVQVKAGFWMLKLAVDQRKAVAGGTVAYRYEEETGPYSSLKEVTQALHSRLKPTNLREVA